jgi:quercetin dioxygenase-like cupin family protein
MRRWAAALVGLSVAACGGSSAATQPPPTSLGTTIADARGTLAQAAVSRQPEGPLYISVVETDMQRTGAITEQREPGFELVLSGDEHITAGTAPAITVQGGQAVFVRGDAVTRFEPDGAAVTYFVSLRPAVLRSRAFAPGRRALYESADLPRAATPPGGYQDALILLVLQPGAVVPPHMHGGIEPTYVIDGTIELKVAGRPAVRLGPGDGDTVLPDTPLLLTNVGPTIARVLVMLATPDGKPVQSSASPP